MYEMNANAARSVMHLFLLHEIIIAASAFSCLFPNGVLCAVAFKKLPHLNYLAIWVPACRCSWVVSHKPNHSSTHFTPRLHDNHTHPLSTSAIHSLPLPTQLTDQSQNTLHVILSTHTALSLREVVAATLHGEKNDYGQSWGQKCFKQSALWCSMVAWWIQKENKVVCLLYTSAPIFSLHTDTFNFYT